MTLESRGKRERIGRMTGGERVPATPVRSFAPCRELQRLRYTLADGDRLDQIHADVRDLGLVLRASHHVDGRGRTEQAAELPQHFARFEELVSSIAADQRPIHIVVKRMRGQRESAADGDPEQVLSRWKMRHIRCEILDHRLDASVPWGRWWTSWLRDDLSRIAVRFIGPSRLSPQRRP